MSFTKAVWLWGVSVLMLSALQSVAARTNTISGNWSDPSIWSGTQVPQPGEDVVITTDTTVTNDTVSGTPMLASFTNNGTLVFQGWTNALSAGNVAINGTVTHLPNTDTNSPWVPDQRVYIVCTNLIVTTGGVINADARGYGCPMWTNVVSEQVPGYGPGGGTNTGFGGGGYGGAGGHGGQPYGSTNAPTDPGSGGYPCYDNVGEGGGAVRIEASGMVTVNGTISANGRSTSSGGGGSGGGIYITCSTFYGTNGVIRAVGGPGNGSGGAGGGGRIAVVYNPAAQGLLAPPTVLFAATFGVNPANFSYNGDLGTLYFPDLSILNTALFTQSGALWVPGCTSLSVADVTFSNCALRFPPERFALTVTNSLALTGTNANYHGLQLSNALVTCGGNLLVNNMQLFLSCGATSGPIVDCGGSLKVTNGGILHVYSCATNASWSPSGAMVRVAGALRLSSNSWIYPYSNPTNGGSPYFSVGSLSVDAGGGIDAKRNGYSAGKGPGVGKTGYGGGSYGGYGGNGGGTCGDTYGSSNAPVAPGSGGCNSTWQGPGGGLVWLRADGSIAVNGIITTKPYYLSATSDYGGGSGGGIYLVCRSFSGTGVLRAAGCDTCYASTGGGGGGRIAVWRTRDTSHLSETNVAGGTNATPACTGSPGTIVWGWLPESGTVFVVH